MNMFPHTFKGYVYFHHKTGKQVSILLRLRQEGFQGRSHHIKFFSSTLNDVYMCSVVTLYCLAKSWKRF